MPGAKKGRSKAKGKRGGRRAVANVKDFGSLSDNRTYAAPTGNIVANQMYSIMTTTLSQYDRGIQAAKAYQFYRIKHISVKIKPQFDTYAFNQNGGATPTGYGKPKLYFMFDKSGSLPTNITLEALKQMGSKPRNLDEKAINISWSPTVLNSAMSVAGAATTTSQYKVTPWLATNANSVSPGVWVPNDVDHLGVYWYVESTSYGGTGGLPYQVDVEVQFEFKKPLWSAVGNTNAIGLVPAIVDASPDGVEGGSDGITIPISLH